MTLVSHSPANARYWTICPIFLPATLELAGAALVLILLISVPLGMGARHRDRLPDFAICFIAFLGVSMPNFWLAFLLVMAFSVYLQWLPRWVTAAGSTSFCLRFPLPLCRWRLMRVYCAPVCWTSPVAYVTWARLRGLNDKQTERRHILRNASLPMITAVGVHIGELIGGTMIMKTSLRPGIGRYAVSAIFNRDYPVIQCFTLMMVVVFVVCNLIVDLLNAAPPAHSSS
ncbi:ABC transporter permease subunit [Escherichia coli]